MKQIKVALRSAAKYSLWHKPVYAELVIIELRKIKGD